MKEARPLMDLLFVRCNILPLYSAGRKVVMKLGIFIAFISRSWISRLAHRATVGAGAR